MKTAFQRFLHNKRFLLLAAILLVLGGYALRLDALAWHIWPASSKPAKGHSLKLQDYAVELDGARLQGIDEGVSGLTFNGQRNTLFTVLNREPWVVELALDGRVLRKIHVDGMSDMEGITHVDGNRYVVVNERDQRLTLLTIEDGAESVDASKAPQLVLGVDASGNKNFEGVSWDERNKRLIVVKERDPKRVLAVHGFIDAEPDQPMQLRVEKLQQSKSAFDRLHDLSSVTFHDATGHLVLLSHESRMVAEFDRKGRLVGTLALWRGFHGLKHNIPQAEGIAIGTDRRIYVVSEPNLLYVFKPTNL